MRAPHELRGTSSSCTTQSSSRGTRSVRRAHVVEVRSSHAPSLRSAFLQGTVSKTDPRSDLRLERGNGPCDDEGSRTWTSRRSLVDRRPKRPDSTSPFSAARAWSSGPRARRCVGLVRAGGQRVFRRTPAAPQVHGGFVLVSCDTQAETTLSGRSGSSARGPNSAAGEVHVRAVLAVIRRRRGLLTDPDRLGAARDEARLCMHKLDWEAVAAREGKAGRDGPARPTPDRRRVGLAMVTVRWDGRGVNDTRCGIADAVAR